MKQLQVLALACLAFCLPAAPAHAYIGPGAGLSAFGALAALVGAVALAFIGFLWYPIKRLMRKRRAPGGAPAARTADKPGPK